MKVKFFNNHKVLLGEYWADNINVHGENRTVWRLLEEYMPFEIAYRKKWKKRNGSSL